MKIFKGLLFALALRSEKLPDKQVKTVREGYRQKEKLPTVFLWLNI